MKENLGKSEVQELTMQTARRIKEMREISGFSAEDMALKTGISLEEYLKNESGEVDLPFSFIHNCALIFGIDIADLLEGHSPRLTRYQITRGGRGKVTVDENGILIKNLASKFVDKIAEPYFVTYEYSKELQDKPIDTNTHSGQEFDYIVKGSLKVRVGNHVETLGVGDSILYNSSTPHGMIAVNGEPCSFIAIVLPGEKTEEKEIRESIVHARSNDKLICEKFIKTVEDEEGRLKKISFKHTDEFNFAFDCVGEIAKKYPDKLAMLHVDKNHNERRFTFAEIKEESDRTANYFLSLEIKKGDRVMLILKRHFEFWLSMLALEKIGAIAIPATYQLVTHDLEYRFALAGVSAIVCTSDGEVASHVDEAEKTSPTLKTKIIVGEKRDGWHDFRAEYKNFDGEFFRTKDCSSGNEPAVMFFTSGTTGYPKIATHSHLYALGHFVTAKYWHCVERDGLHLTISDTGWGKALWGKLYGQWLSEGAVFVYDFDKFDANDILPMFKKYNITTFCAPPTMLRMMIKEDLSKFDLTSIKHMTTAGEALNPEVFKQFQKATGHEIMEGFGQTETTLVIGNLFGTKPKIGSMGVPSPQYDVDIVDENGNSVPVGETGEIVIHTDKQKPVGLFNGYYHGEDKTNEVWHDGLYHTGDTAWKDEDGYYWYVGRVDDVIKSSGYRIGPFEIENVIMELPYVLECGVSAVPDEVRGQVVKASIVLTKGTTPSEELKKEIQNYVKTHTAPYKYPRVVVFCDELPKTISGKIQRNKL